jgi:hypothetical protein
MMSGICQSMSTKIVVGSGKMPVADTVGVEKESQMYAHLIVSLSPLMGTEPSRPVIYQKNKTTIIGKGKKNMYFGKSLMAL